MSKTEQQPRDSLLTLVQYVFDHRDGLIHGVTYQDLASWIGRLDKHGTGHAHGMGWVLGQMGHLLQDIDGDEWGEGIPHIQSLVVQKTGPNRGLPDEGIREFWPDYPNLSHEEKLNRVRVEHDRIVNFGSRWNDVLDRLGLPRVLPQDTPDVKPRGFGAGGESIQHKLLKEYVREHPEIVGAERYWESFVEYALPTCDQIDVLFKSSETCIAVEVKSSVSDLFPFDYERGIYQTIKYGALLRAMSTAGSHDIPLNVQSVLVLESALPLKFRKLAADLGVTVIENARLINNKSKAETTANATRKRESER